jgi:PIN domain nuclease of toxin-antitoxin system
MPLVIDTHAAIWYLSNSDQLSSAALDPIESAVKSRDDVFLSAISLVEVIYLAEKGKLPFDAVKKLENALHDADASIIVAPLDYPVVEAVKRVSRAAIPDMPDRIISATALHLGVPLVTRDRRIQAAGINTIW